RPQGGRGDEGRLVEDPAGRGDAPGDIRVRAQDRDTVDRLPCEEASPVRVADAPGGVVRKPGAHPDLVATGGQVLAAPRSERGDSRLIGRVVDPEGKDAHAPASSGVSRGGASRR